MLNLINNDLRRLPTNYEPGKKSLAKMKVKVKYYPATQLRYLVITAQERRQQTCASYLEVPIEFNGEEIVNFLLKNTVSYQVNYPALVTEVGKWHARELILKRVFNALKKNYPEYRQAIEQRQTEELAWCRLQKNRL